MDEELYLENSYKRVDKVTKYNIKERNFRDKIALDFAIIIFLLLTADLSQDKNSNSIDLQ